MLQVSPKELAELKANFMELYDDNKDGKIEIREVDVRAWIFEQLLLSSN